MALLKQFEDFFGTLALFRNGPHVTATQGKVNKQNKRRHQRTSPRNLSNIFWYNRYSYRFVSTYFIYWKHVLEESRLYIIHIVINGCFCYEVTKRVRENSVNTYLPCVTVTCGPFLKRANVAMSPMYICITTVGVPKSYVILKF